MSGLIIIIIIIQFPKVWIIDKQSTTATAITFLSWQKWLERRLHFPSEELQKAVGTGTWSPWCLLWQSWYVCQSLRPIIIIIINLQETPDVSLRQEEIWRMCLVLMLSCRGHKWRFSHTKQQMCVHVHPASRLLPFYSVHFINSHSQLLLCNVLLYNL